MMRFFAYILVNPQGRYYIGHSSDPQSRLGRHNEGKVFWTRSHRPWDVAYVEEFATRSLAMAREKQLKRLKSKEALAKICLSGRVPTSRD